MRRSSGGLLALLLITSGAAIAAAQVAEPQALWDGPMHGETPSTLAGAQVVDAPTVAELKQGGALLLDVAETPKKPENMAPDALWRPIHMSIPGAVWLAGAGQGNASPAFQSRFDERLAGLTGGRKNRLYGNNPTGAIFALKNYGWIDKQQNELSGPGGGPMQSDVTLHFVKTHE